MEYDDLADGLGEERDSIVQKVVDEVFELFKPLARREWLSWGGDLLFSDLYEEVERERKEEEVIRILEEENAIRQAEETAKKTKIEDRKAALGAARNAALLEFRAKTLSKEDLQQRNAELAAEAKAIERDEVGDEVESERQIELPVVKLGKRKAVRMEDDEDGEDELNEQEIEAKRAKYATSGLLDFEGSVSSRN